MAGTLTCRSLVIFALASAPSPALYGQTTDARSASDAARHFDRGYLLAQQGNLEAAIAEFEQAQSLSPNPTVLYNLGQAYAASGRAVEAVRVLRQYLAQADPNQDQEKRASATALIGYQSQRIGALLVDVEPAGAEITLDGVTIGKAPLSEPVPVTAGVHGLVVSAPGYQPHVTRVEITGKVSSRTNIALRPSDSAIRLRVRCAVPDVLALADGRPIGMLRQGGELVLTTAPSEPRFERSGYVARTQPFPAQRDAAVDCGLQQIDSKAPLSKVAVSAPPGARVTVNGTDFRSGRLPLGRHLLSVSGSRIVAAQHSLRLKDTSPQHIRISTSEAREALLQDREQRRYVQRTAAVVLGGAGFLGLTGASVLYLVNQERYKDWRRDTQTLAQRMQSDSDAVTARDWNELFERENSLRNRDAVALGGAVAGGTLLATAAALWFTAPRAPERSVTVRIGKTSSVSFEQRF